MDAFTRNYLAAALWAETDDDDQPWDDNYEPEDFGVEDVKEAEKETKEFRRMAGKAIHADEGRAAADFWLTRQHHGAGFWDGDWGREGNRLTKIAQKFPERYIYMGADEALHFG